MLHFPISKKCILSCVIFFHSFLSVIYIEMAFSKTVYVLPPDRGSQSLMFTSCWRLKYGTLLYRALLLALVAWLDVPSDWRPGGRGFNPRRGRQHSFVEIDLEIFSTVILSLPLIQEGQLSVSGERMCTILVNRLED